MLPFAMILAGGAGRRMGGHKPFYNHKGRPLIAAVIAALRPQARGLFINASAPDHPAAGDLAATGLPVRFDAPEIAGLGPLSGIHTALQTAASLGETLIVTAPCDMPHLPADMIRQLMEGYDDSADVVHFHGVRDYPLCALWHTRQLPRLADALSQAQARGGLAVMGYLRTCAVVKIAVTDDHAFANINAPPTDAQAE